MKRLSKFKGPAGLMILLLGAVVIASGALVISCSHSSQSPDAVSANTGPPLAARVDQLDGSVGIAQPAANQAQAGQAQATQVQNEPPSNVGWTQAGVNAPVSVGSRIYARENSKVGIAFSGRNYARLNPNTGLDVLALSQRRTQLALREGSCTFSVGALAKDELFEVGTPNGAVDFTEAGLYQVGTDDGGNVLVSCLSGGARVFRHSGQCEIAKGQLVTLEASTDSDAIVSQLSPTVAGTICNDYYSYRYPSTYDGRYADYDRYLNDPYYYDPYRRSVSYQYIPDDSEVAGLDDLDQYGDWTDVPDYGHCWRPRVSAGWAPYRDGYWSDDYPLGLTWVANEHWGWAPYHYGRWAFVDQNWMWVPKEVVSQPVYAPALVAFVQMPEPDRVAWLPLGPGDPYVPRYYGPDYRPQYIGSTTAVDRYVNITNVTNYNVPGAVTVVDTTQFTRVITPATVERVDPAVLARTRPVVDPYAVPSVRQLAPDIVAARPSAPMPVTAEQALVRPVVISQNPVLPQVASNTVQGFKAQAVPEDAKKNKLKVKEGGQPVATVRPDGMPVAPVSPQPMGGQNAQQQMNPQQQQQSQMATQQRQARIAQLAPQAEQGDKSAKREMRQLQDQQRIEDKAARKAAAQQGTAQQAAGQQQGPNQSAEQRKAAKQAAQQQAQQAEQERQARATQLDAQQKAQKQAARQQAAQQAQQAATQQQQQRQQEKAARKAQQQQQAQQQAQQAQGQQQQRQQEKAARRAAQQQAAQQQAEQAQQQRQQQKAQRRAEQQNAPQPQSPQKTNPSKEERKQKNKNSGQQ